MINLFCGFDKREEVGFSVFVSSVLQYATKPVAIIPLANTGMKEGTTAFTCSRFLIPQLMGFKGVAIFVDACDMLMRADIAKLAELFNPNYAVQVVKHPEYVSMQKRKYMGTQMEAEQSNYRRKNWASVMLINCDHSYWESMTPGYIATQQPVELLNFNFLEDEMIGELPNCWNRLVDEGHLTRDAAILHWSSGMPGFPHYRGAPAAEYWHHQRHIMLASARP